MTYLLDSNACIALLSDGDSNVKEQLKLVGVANVTICSIVVAELAYGVERSSPKRRADNRIRLEMFQRKIPSLPFDDNAAHEYGRIRAHLASLGTPIGPNDLMIASIALANNLTLITHNTAEFSRIPALQLEDWQ